MNDTRDQLLLIARIAFECGRYLDVIEALRPIFVQKIELTSSERYVLGQAFKIISRITHNYIYSIHFTLKEAEEKGNTREVKLIQKYYQRLMHEFRLRLKECGNIIHEYLLPFANDPEAQVHYFLMQIHFWYRFSNFSRGPEQISAISNTYKLSIKAKELADAHLKVTNPIVLELISLYVTFLHARLDRAYDAMTLGRAVHLAVIDHLHEVTEDDYKEVTMFLKIIEDSYRCASHFVPDYTEEANKTIANT